MNGRKMTRAQALARIRSQPPQAEKLAQADVVIDTSGTMDYTEKQVEWAWRRELDLEAT
jgi:dephospho-CoA kinase